MALNEEDKIFGDVLGQLDSATFQPVTIVISQPPETNIRQGEAVSLRLQFTSATAPLSLTSATFVRYVQDNGLLYKIAAYEEADERNLFLYVCAIFAESDTDPPHSQTPLALCSHKTCRSANFTPRNVLQPAEVPDLRQSASIDANSNELICLLRITENPRHIKPSAPTSRDLSDTVPSCNTIRLQLRLLRNTQSPILTRAITVSSASHIPSALPRPASELAVHLSRLCSRLPGTPSLSIPLDSTALSSTLEPLFSNPANAAALVSTRDDIGRTLLHYAVLLELLPAVGVVVSTCDTAGTLRALLSTADINGATPLHTATMHGVIHAANLFMEKAADRRRPDLLGLCPLDYVDMATSEAALSSDSDDQDPNNSGGDSIANTATAVSPSPMPTAANTSSLLSLRSASGPAVNNAAPSNAEADTTLLHEICFAGDTKRLRTELNALAEEHRHNPADMCRHVDARDREGSTPLHLAAFRGHAECASLLISSGADVNAIDKEGNTALHKAAFNGHTAVVRLLVGPSAAAELAVANVLGATPLHFAALTGRVDIVDTLITAGASVDAVDTDGSTPLHKAAYGGHAAVVRLLASLGARVDIVDNRGATPLHIAAYKDRTEAAIAFIEAGANVDAVDSDGVTPLHHACYHGNAALATELAVTGGADMNIRDRANQTPLHIAALRGHTACVKALVSVTSPPARHTPDLGERRGDTSPLHHAAFGGLTEIATALLSAGHSVDARDSEESTPLHKAAFFGHVAVVKLLLAHSANANAADAEGSTPLHKASFSGHVDVVDMLLAAGADVDVQDNEDGTPLHNAAFNGHVRVCEKLLTAGMANLNSADANGASPLHLAALNGHLRVAAVLVDHGADVSTPDDTGMTALHHAVEFPDMVEYLVAKARADVDAVDNDGRTPLYYAAAGGLVDTVRILVLHGANVDKPDNDGRTPRDVGSARPEVAAALRGEASPGSPMSTATRPHSEASNGAASSSSPLAERKWKSKADDPNSLETVVKTFNRLSDKKALEYLMGHPAVGPAPEEIARFLFRAAAEPPAGTGGGPRLNKTKVGELLSAGDELNRRILAAFVQQMDFGGLEIDDALRRYLTKFRLPGEAQRIDRLMEAFARRYCATNPEKAALFPNADTAYLLAFSLIMLNTDAHNPNIAPKDKMRKEQFLKMTSGIAEGKDLPAEYLTGLYDRIVSNEIKMESDGSLFANPEKKGWLKKQGGRWKSWKKRWVVLAGNCLTYFKQNTDLSTPCGIIPLENLLVREASDAKKKFCFELYTGEKEKMKAVKINASSGIASKGHHDRYLMHAKSRQEMEDWMAAIRAQIVSSPILELINKRKTQQSSSTRPRGTTPPAAAAAGPSGPIPRGHSDIPAATDDGSSVNAPAAATADAAAASTTSVNRRELFKMLHSYSVMCSTAYKSSSIVKETFGSSAIVMPLSLAVNVDERLRNFFIMNPQEKTQTVVLVGMVTIPITLATSTGPTTDADAAVRIIDIQKTYRIDDLTKEFYDRFKKYAKNSYSTLILGHSLGALVAVSLARRLVTDGYKVSRVVTFGQPRSFLEKPEVIGPSESTPGSSGKKKDKIKEDRTVLNVTRVFVALDPVPWLFPGYATPTYPGVGSCEVLLLRAGRYCYREDSVNTGDEPDKPRQIDSSIHALMTHNHIETYVRNLRKKATAPISEIPWAERLRAEAADLAASGTENDDEEETAVPAADRSQSVSSPGAPRRSATSSKPTRFADGRKGSVFF